MHCDDVGIYLNKSGNTLVYNNTLVNTLGIDVRFEQSSALIGNNVLTGRIADRDGGSSDRVNNLVFDMDELNEVFVAPTAGDFTLKSAESLVDRGNDLQAQERDFCGTPRGPGGVDLGAMEFNDGREAMCRPLGEF